MSLPPSRPLECKAPIKENRKRPRSFLEEVLGAEDDHWPEDVQTCRYAGMTPEFFTPRQHLYMCCGRPIVVHLLMSLSPPPPFLITSWFDESKIWGIRFYTLSPWGLVTLLTDVFHR